MKKVLLFALAALCVLGAVFFIASSAGYEDWEPVDLFPGSAKGPANNLYFSFHPSNMATDLNGNLYVMDYEKIIRFTPKGKLDTTWGKDGRCYLSINSMNVEYTRIVADSRGYVYGVRTKSGDTEDMMVVRFTPEGELDRSWYNDACIAAGKEAPLKSGDIAVDSRDNLYLFNGDEVFRLTSNGEPVPDWNGIKAAYPEDDYKALLNFMVMGDNDKIFIFSEKANTITKYDASGRLLDTRKSAFNIVSLRSSRFDRVGKTEIDKKGMIYNINENLLKRYGPDAELDTSWCNKGVFRGVKTNGLESPAFSFTLDGEGNLYVSDELGEIRKYTTNGTLDTSWGKDGALGNVDVIDGIYHQIGGMASDGLGNLYVADYPWGYERTLLYRFDSDLNPDENWYKNALRYSNVYCYSQPVVDEAGRLYFWTADEAFRLKPDGTKDDAWKMKRIDEFAEIMFAQNGYTYWINEQYAMERYDASGKKDTAWGNNGSLHAVYGSIVFDDSGCFYTVIDEAIFKFTPQGRPDTTWCDKNRVNIGDTTWCNNSRIHIGDMALDNTGNLYAIDILNNRLLRYKSDGSPDTSWGNNGSISLPPSESYEEMGKSNDTDIAICGGRIYVSSDSQLYVLNDEMARVDMAPAAAEPAQPGNDVWWLVVLAVVTAGGVGFDAQRREKH